jgi:hypothetical protein
MARVPKPNMPLTFSGFYAQIPSEIEAMQKSLASEKIIPGSPQVLLSTLAMLSSKPKNWYLESTNSHQLGYLLGMVHVGNLLY